MATLTVDQVRGVVLPLSTSSVTSRRLCTDLAPQDMKDMDKLKQVGWKTALEVMRLEQGD